MLNSGDILDKKYEVIRILGKGGMGIVYLCKNIRLGNFWAIKEVIKDTKNIDVLTEANILKDLNHPGIRRIVDIFYAGNNLYMVQDYVDGQTLKEYVDKSGRMQTEKICNITSDLCDIVGYLHNQNPAIIYRDIKPSNIMITTSGKIVLIDFGISKIYKSDTLQDTVCACSNGYAAPEQYGSGKACTQTDIYGIGMLVYFMIKGRTPFTGIEPLLDENYETYINQKLKKIIQKCVKIDIKDRYISVKVLKKEISEVLKKDKYEKTTMLIEHNSSTNVIISKDKFSILNRSKSNKNVRGFSCFIVAILACIYILYWNKKENMLMDTIARTEIVRPIVGSSIIEYDAINQSRDKYVNESMMVTTNNTSMPNSQYKIINEKKSILSKVKVGKKTEVLYKVKANEKQK